MNYNWKFTIPEDTLIASPHVKSCKITYGRITHVIISNPGGSVGKSHLQVFFHEFQLYPLNKGEWYEGENIRIEFDDNYLLFTHPFVLKFKGYNTSTKHVHAFYINVTVLRDEILEGSVNEELFTGMRGEV